MRTVDSGQWTGPLPVLTGSRGHGVTGSRGPGVTGSQGGTREPGVYTNARERGRAGHGGRSTYKGRRDQSGVCEAVSENLLERNAIMGGFYSI